MEISHEMNALGLSTTNAIAQSLSLQIESFLASIASREEGPRYPNEKEIGMICRLINCLDKLRRLFTASAKKDNFDSFIHFLKETDKDFAKAVNTRYKDFTRHKDAIIPEPASQPAEQQHALNIPAQTTNQPEIPNPTNNNNTPPVTKEDYDRHKHLLHELHAGSKQKVDFNNRQVSLNWLQYNLFQWRLPIAERRFFADEAQYHEKIDHAVVCRKIKHFFARNKEKK